MRIAPVTPSDAEEWLRLRVALWPADPAAHRPDIERFLAGERRLPLEVLVAFDEAGAAVGFAELSIRNIVDSCRTDRVGYLEGWYVEPAHRRRGVGAALVRAAERWARDRGCEEFASDALVANEVALAAHRALGFEETARVCCFRKELRDAATHASARAGGPRVGVPE